MDISLNIITLVIIVMIDLLPMENARSLHHQQNTKNRTRNQCVGGRWVKVGSFRFWQRKTCINRRQMQAQPGKPKVDLEDIPSLEGGPERGVNYDPTYGYEPYWVDGDWVFDPRPSNKSDANFMCGTRCSKVYEEYGTLCARNKFYEYKTFENYCQLRNQDCSGVLRWMILYRGKCYRELMEYERHDLQEKAKQYIVSFITEHPDHHAYVGLCRRKNKRRNRPK